ncbi:MAG: mechanosensitive ion channel, partial [Deltaproteobacteria bacterium]|nr:mechanosensitive ion channel [Deltaproteobacteria bacterium]
MNFRKEQLLEAIAQISPNRYFQALLIILLFFGIAKILNVIITRVIKRWITKTKVTFDDEILDIFHKPIFVGVILFGLAMAVELLELNETLNIFTLGSLKTVAILLWTVAFGRLMKLLIRLVSRDNSRFIFIQDQTLPLFNNLLMILVVTLSIYFILLAWNIDVTAWMASAGILGLAISFAAKDTLANLFSGVFIVADAPFKLGDFIV